MLVVHMIGNAHIDPVWLWGWQAGVDEALSTLAAAADRCDEYPDFIYTRGEAWLYRQAERLRPDVFARIRRHVAAGQWRIVGGTYVQPDLNLPTEMALRRQIRHGQGYFQDRFGTQPRIGYNVDSFGHPASLPDILAEHGYEAYVFGRPDPRQFDFPHSAFLWRGAGGAELPAFRVYPGYAFSNADISAHIAMGVARSDPALGHTMCFYGVGNHGGGPTRAQIEWIRANRFTLPGLELRLSSPVEFFAAIAPHRDILPVVEGELQHCFPGCYSAMGGIKRAQRQAEHLLDQAERAARALVPDASAHLARIDTAWDDALFTSFHDIVTGTSTPSAWASVSAMQGRARMVAEETILDVTRSWAERTLPASACQRLVLVNTDDSAFDGMAECETWIDYDLWQNRYLTDADGTPIPFQQTQPDGMHRIPRLLFPVNVPALGGIAVTIRPGPAPKLEVSSDLHVSPTRLENSRLRLDLGPSGVVSLAVDGQEMLGPSGMTLHLRHDHTDTWCFDTDTWSEAIAETLTGGVWVVEEAGPLRARVRMEHRIGTSRLRWTLSLNRFDPAVTLRIEVNFDERYKLLQLALSLRDPPQSRVDAVPGGAIARPLSATEFPVQGWSRLAFPGVGLAMLSQDAFSLRADAQLWQWTLLRSPRMAWQGGESPIYHGRDVHTDQGMHDIALRLRAADGATDIALHREARCIAQKLIAFDRSVGVIRPLP